MINWFEIFADRLTAIEEGQKELRSLLTNPASDQSDSGLYGSFHWLSDTCAGIPPSTLRIKSAKGKIPGVVKFGKRVLYEKAVVLKWLRSQTLEAADETELSRAANEQVSRQLAKGRGVSA